MSAGTAQLDEVAFLSGMTREEEQEDTRLLFKLDGHIAREVGNLETKLREHIVSTMKEHVPDRQPKDYDENERDLKSMLFEAARLGSLMGKREYNNGDGDEDKQNWKAVALWALSALQAIGLIVLGFVWSNVTELRTSQAQTHDDVTQIKCKLDPQCRIVVTK